MIAIAAPVLGLIDPLDDVDAAILWWLKANMTKGNYRLQLGAAIFEPYKTPCT